MITTRFLGELEYLQYATWVKKLDTSTRATYFGSAYTDEMIDRLVQGMADNPKLHTFLVAEFKGEWIGTVHIAQVNPKEVEFGFIVDAEHRGNGIADRLMGEAITWSRNRGYESLYMHCLSWNTPIKRLCLKHGMELYTESGETDTKLDLAPPDFKSVTDEVMTRNRNVYRMMLQTMVPFLEEVYT